MNKKQKFILSTYICLLTLGGIMGYVKSGSVMSLVMSLSLSGLFLAMMVLATKIKNSLSYTTFFLLAVDLFFTYRFLKTSKFMPAGLFAIITFMVLIFFIRASKKLKAKG